MTYEIMHSSLKGLRDDNEDTHIILTSEEINKKYPSFTSPIIFFVGVFDGHGGRKVSEFLSKNIDKYFFNNPEFKLPVNPEIVRKIFKKLQHDLVTLKIGIDQGSMININFVYSYKSEIYCATINLGDTRTILADSEKIYQITNDHRVSLPKERNILLKKGAQIKLDYGDWRIGPANFSRSIGDSNIKYISHLPEIHVTLIEPRDKILIIGCDGLFDVATNDHAILFVMNELLERNKHKGNNENIAAKLASHAIKMLNSTDNVSVIVVLLNFK